MPARARSARAGRRGPAAADWRTSPMSTRKQRKHEARTRRLELEAAFSAADRRRRRRRRAGLAAAATAGGALGGGAAALGGGANPTGHAPAIPASPLPPLPPPGEAR